MMKNLSYSSIVDLSGEWSLTWSKTDARINSVVDLDSDRIEWIPAVVPGEIHFDILGEDTAEDLFNSYLVIGDWHCRHKECVTDHSWIERTYF